MNTPGEQPNPMTPEAEARVRELQAMITEAQRKADKAEDEDIREAHNLRAAKLGLMVARLKRGQPETLPEAVEEAIEAEAEPLPVPTPEQLREADQLIQRAMLEKRRGNKQASTDLMKKAAEVAPGAASVLEALGDDLMERKHYAAAHEAYRSAHRAEPSNAGIERKFAQVSMIGRAGMSFEDQLRLASSDNPFIQQGESLANPKWAVVLSIIVPGSGQFALGNSKKGAIIFGICVAGGVLFAILTQVMKTGHTSLPAVAYIPLAIAIASWLAGVADASSVAKGSRMSLGDMPVKKGAVDRPVPPVNLPFE